MYLRNPGRTALLGGRRSLLTSLFRWCLEKQKSGYLMARVRRQTIVVHQYRLEELSDVEYWYYQLRCDIRISESPEPSLDSSRYCGAGDRYSSTDSRHHSPILTE